MDINDFWSRGHSRGFRGILIHLNKKIDYASSVARELNICSSGIITKFKILREDELIELIENKGRNRRKKYYKLTKKGKKITELLLKIDEELKNGNKDSFQKSVKNRE